MLETMLVGALMLYMSVLVRYFQPTSLTCLVEPWLRELGFSTFYGSILIKLYRILTEFQTRKAHRVCLRDKDQIIYLLAIVFIVIGYMSAWTALMVDGFFVRQDAGQALNGVSSQSSSLPEGDAFFLPPTKNSQADGSESPMSNVQRSELVKRALGDLEQESSLTSPFSYDGQMPPFVARTITTTRPGSQLVDGGEQNKYHKPATNHHLELSAVPALVQNNSDLPPVYLNYHQGGGEDETRNMRRNPRETTSGLFNDHLEILAHGLNSFGELFLGLLESEQRFDLASDSYVLSIRCRKLTWDYVTESSESRVVYKL